MPSIDTGTINFAHFIRVVEEYFLANDYREIAVFTADWLSFFSEDTPSIHGIAILESTINRFSKIDAFLGELKKYSDRDVFDGGRHFIIRPHGIEIPYYYLEVRYKTRTGVPLTYTESDIWQTIRHFNPRLI